MSNKEIIGKLKRTAKLMELHGANDFKIRSYQNAIQRLERIHEPFVNMDESTLLEIEGLGKSIASIIAEISKTGTAILLEEYEDQTPVGLKDLMQFRGVGTKKLRTLWNEFGVEDKSALKILVNSGQLLSVKGFGEKTVKNLAEIVEFAFECEGKTYYSEAEIIGNNIISELKEVFIDAQISFVGKLRRKWEVIDAIELLTDIPLPKLMPVLEKIAKLNYDKKKSGPFSWKGKWIGDINIDVIIYPTPSNKFVANLLLKTGSPEHLGWVINETKFRDFIKQNNWQTEDEYYSNAGLGYCEPEIREAEWEVPLAMENKLPELIKLEDLKGILHNHTTYSDGQNTVREMAEECKSLGYDYLGITDHSKAASFYANGMFEERVKLQQDEIDKLNTEFGSFKIFKGIEADILADGALDYDNDTLSTFDFVVASIHSGFSMDKTKATERLITAIANPHTTFLGHMTGRILLQRQGYPVDHEAIFNACAEFGVIIEINAHPKRLDIDWRWIHRALDKGLILSINPDAHEIAGYKDMYYGVCVGRKGGLTKEQTFNAWSLEQVEDCFTARKEKLL
ncbi:MAG: DNA polymerase/3'-5' exonuclease PolX [Bacteroidetes bacterium]|nr:MAG: DNA polymerase/3'-5' exonuclease PolX [Bacteroidota bacterium]